MEQTKKSAFGITALVLGIIGVCLSFIPIINNVAFFLGALALIFAIVCLVKKASKGLAITSIVLGVAAIVITIVMQAVTLNALNKVTNDLTNGLDNIAGNNTEDILKNNVEVNIGKFEIVKGEFLDETKLNINIKNISDGNKSFSIKIEAVDANGTRIEDDTIYVDVLGSGQDQNFKMFTLIDSETAQKLQSATFKVVEVSMY